MLFRIELLIDQAALRLANSLNDHLLCRLRRDPAELLCLHRDPDGVAHLGSLGDLFCRIRVDLMGGVRHFLDNQFVHLHVNALFILIENDLDIILILRMVAPKRRQHRLTDLIVHIGSRDALFLFDILDGSKEFCIHNSLLSVSDSSDQ